MGESLDGLVAQMNKKVSGKEKKEPKKKSEKDLEVKELAKDIKALLGSVLFRCSFMQAA